MGKLKPGVTYIYERADGVTYAREMGAPANERVAIGWDYEIQIQKQLEMDEWLKVIEASRTNPALHDALERVKIIYELSREPDNEPPMWHPV